MPKSTYYHEIKNNNAISQKDTDLIEIIKDIFNENKGRYGVRRVYYEIKNRGITVNHKRVQRIMHSLKLFGKRPKEKYHSYKGEVDKTADNIINRNFKADAPYEKITTDVSQFNFSWGKCYLSPVIDMYSNEVLGYDLSLHPNLEQISHMLDMTFSNMPHTKDTIFHSDQGWQYQHNSFISELKKHSIIQSMSRKGNCYDNCIMESFFGRMKNEMYYGHEKDFESFEEFSIAVDEYIYYYNNKRIQSKTKWMPPVVYRETSIC